METLFICTLGKRASASAALIRPPTGTSPPGKSEARAGLGREARRSKQDGRGTRQRAGTEWVPIRPAVPVHERIARHDSGQDPISVPAFPPAIKKAGIPPAHRMDIL
jgi:hypothetical protein